MFKRFNPFNSTKPITDAGVTLLLPQAEGKVYKSLGRAIVYKINKILAPVDFSNLSKLGLHYALEIANSQEAEIIIYNIITVEETPYPQGAEEWVAKQTEVPKVKKILERRRKQLERFVADEFAPIADNNRVRLEVEIGTPYKKIVEKAKQESTDMIVMSTHGRTGVMHMLIGSVTERVVRRAPCPVLSVPPPQKKKKTRKYWSRGDRSPEV